MRGLRALPGRSKGYPNPHWLALAFHSMARVQNIGVQRSIAVLASLAKRSAFNRAVFSRVARASVSYSVTAARASCARSSFLKLLSARCRGGVSAKVLSHRPWECFPVRPMISSHLLDCLLRTIEKYMTASAASNTPPNIKISVVTIVQSPSLRARAH